MSELQKRLRAVPSIRRDSTPLSVAVALCSEAADALDALVAETATQAQEIARLREAIRLQGRAAISGMDAAKAISGHQLETAAKLRAESRPEAIESEREMNAILTAENDALRARLADAEQELRNIAESARWDQSVFDGQVEWGDWVQSRCRHTLASNAARGGA